jgi:hypothetical protein
MQLLPHRTFQSAPSQKEAIPYSSAALRQDLERVRGVWDDCQASRDRNAIYGYLTAVYGSFCAKKRSGPSQAKNAPSTSWCIPASRRPAKSIRPSTICVAPLLSMEPFEPPGPSIS